MHNRLDGGAGFLLDVQANLLSGFNTRLVVPLLLEHDAPKPAVRLNPVFEVAGERVVMVTQFAAAVHMSELGTTVATLHDRHERVTAALNLLITGV